MSTTQHASSLHCSKCTTKKSHPLSLSLYCAEDVVSQQDVMLRLQANPSHCLGLTHRQDLQRCDTTVTWTSCSGPPGLRWLPSPMLRREKNKNKNIKRSKMLLNALPTIGKLALLRLCNATTEVTEIAGT